MFYSLVRSLLFLFKPETAHHLTLFILKILARLKWLPTYATNKNQKHQVCVMGLKFPNRVGLAAGLDKNGECIEAFSQLGFGFVEVGTVTPKPQPGNPLPRMFRLPRSKALINRMGFNNLGVDALIENIKRQKYNCILGVNIGKNKDTPLEKAHHDYLICLEKLYLFADYITVNISSPNTPGLRDLQEIEALATLLDALKKRQKELITQYDKKVPLVVKISPDLSIDSVKEMAEVFLNTKVDGVIATNTTVDKSLVGEERCGKEEGGLSGQPLLEKSLQVITALFSILGDKIPIIASGGIMSGEEAKRFLKAGAKLVQIYTGLIYRGPGLIKEIDQAI